jgi:hypothetical protein
MAKVLTHHDTGEVGTHWFNSASYGHKQIEGIAEKDPTAGKTHTPPTSVPSPFAQMDLTLSAFKNATKDKTLEKLRLVDFKLISDCLDIGQVFFDYEKQKEHIRIIVWDRKANIDLLKNSGDNHRRLADVLELYLNQDKETYNFADLEKIFLLQYDGRVIGGTSSASLFFSSANDLSFVDIKMSNGDNLLDKEYLHLYKRDIKYQMFLHSLRKKMPDFVKKFPSIDTYLSNNLEILRGYNRDQFNQIDALTPESYMAHADFVDFEIDSGDSKGRVYIIGDVPLRKLRYDPNKSVESDFAINSKKYQGDKKPLVLSVGHDGRTNSGEDMIYYENPYRQVKPTVPYYHPLSNWSERALPELPSIKYPYLVASDFLEPYMIRVPYPVNSQQFFDGNLQNSRDRKGFILPIKKLFFDFFDTQDLKIMLKMEWRAGGSVNVRLEIPIQKGQRIVFERLYNSATNELNIPRPDENKNEGVIVQHEVGVSVYPFVRMDTVKPDYRLLLVDRDVYDHTKDNDYKLNFYKNDKNTLIPVKEEENHIRYRTRKQEDGRQTLAFFMLNDNFDYIQIKNDLATGVIVPLFPPASGQTKEFTFAVDFGTTNTHVEYIDSSNKEPRPFDITENDLQIGTFHDRNFINIDASINGTSATELFQFPAEYFPEKIGDQNAHRFPQRTVLTQVSHLKEDDMGSSFAFSDFNIAFNYEKLAILKGSDLYRNLKWSGTKAQGDKRRVEAFFEELLFMMRAKVLRNGGNLSKTKLVAFYPSSMDGARKNRFFKLLKELSKKYFGEESDPLFIPESLAPYYHYKNTAAQVNASVRPAVTIDIGGGTTDIVIFQKVTTDEVRSEEKVIVQTSFRFAANAIFGDGFLRADYSGKEANGFVQRYKDQIKKLITEGKVLYDLEKVYQDIVENNTRSEDITNFFFSLENNKMFTTKTRSTFGKMLEDDDEMRFVFVVFYVAIIYHLAKLMKNQGLTMPAYITFSGNGSRSLEFVTPDTKMLQDLSSIIFAKVYGVTEYERGGLTIAKGAPDTAKPATCKGGLKLTAQEEAKLKGHESDDVQTVLLGTFADENGIPSVSDKAKPFTYKDLNLNTVKITNSVEKEVGAFLQFLFDLNKDFNFNKKLSVEGNLGEYKAQLMSRIDEDLSMGLDIKKAEIGSDPDSLDSIIEETLFFYPLIPALNRLAYYIHEKNS